jgi:hypothetical protein
MTEETLKRIEAVLTADAASTKPAFTEAHRTAIRGKAKLLSELKSHQDETRTQLIEIVNADADMTEADKMEMDFVITRGITTDEFTDRGFEKLFPEDDSTED